MKSPQHLHYSPKALKDLKEIAKLRPLDLIKIKSSIEKNVKSPPEIDNDVIKVMAGFEPKLYRLRIRASIEYRLFFYDHQNSSFIERIVPKKEMDKAIKNYFG